jgi:hypothetical protein
MGQYREKIEETKAFILTDKALIFTETEEKAYDGRFVGCWG